MALGAIFERYLVERNTEEIIGGRRREIVRELEPVYQKAGRVTDGMVLKCFEMIDGLYFAGSIMGECKKEGWGVDFYVSGKLRTTAGMFRYLPTKRILEIVISGVILDGNILFGGGVKKVEIGGIYCTSVCEVLVVLMEHEVTHMVLYLLKDHKLNQEHVKSGHTKVFKKIIYDMFGQTRVRHNLLLGDIDKFNESTESARKNFNLGDRVRCKGKEGVVVVIGKKNVVLKVSGDNYRGCLLKDISMVRVSETKISIEDVRDKLKVGDMVEFSWGGKSFRVKIVEKRSSTFKGIDKDGKMITIYYWVLI
ncbi:MAG: hypothetical protein Hyperionvirus30_11 [Hyperionvirus sp.]|uniref:Uncharacterized protein n=1 Tax=Hyperionvirus sp. TaxID=2487770 RepID=A0A3G5ABK0_9VIRU|nr:MAG: hypothetical protein Hyperionvirus30_11 [Hyperionvirus sp.]